MKILSGDFFFDVDEIAAILFRQTTELDSTIVILKSGYQVFVDDEKSVGALRRWANNITTEGGV